MDMEHFDDAVWVMVNRRAGRARAGRMAPALERLFKQNGFPARFFWPSSREEARSLAAEAVRCGRRRLVVAGGDGTLLDAINSIHGSEIELGIIPAGDANDVSAVLGLPRDPLAAARLLFDWQTRPVDLVRAKCADAPATIFAGVGGAGLDAEAARLAGGRFRFLPGRTRYLASALAAFSRRKAFEVTLDFGEQVYRGPANMVVAANAAAYGGGIRIAPGERMDDGWLSVVLVENLNWLKVARALPSLFRTGGIEGLHPLRFPARRLRIETTPSVAFHGDGEPIGRTPLEIELLPGALRVVCSGAVVR
jgi:diacylglycerol kinase (ATP)